jgi:23S rRNA pseudouridine1911/1915/1917 synthase
MACSFCRQESLRNPGESFSKRHEALNVEGASGMVCAVSATSKNDPKYRGYSYGVRHVEGRAGVPLLDFVDVELARENEPPPQTRLTALELIELGSIYLNDERCLNSSRVLKASDRVRIHTRPRRYPQPIDLRNRIVSETEDVLTVDKPAGLPVHALVDNINENLISYLIELRGGGLFITHRLDIDTSGLVLLAKTPEAAARLNRAFADGTVKRTYAAYVHLAVLPGEYVHFMEPSPKAPKHVAETEHEGWQRCGLTILSCEEQLGATSILTEGRTTWSAQDVVITGFFRLEIQLQTGRPQQIRAQLAALGAPIIGDESYGSSIRLIDLESGKSAIALRAIDVTMTSV